VLHGCKDSIWLLSRRPSRLSKCLFCEPVNHDLCLTNDWVTCSACCVKVDQPHWGAAAAAGQVPAVATRGQQSLCCTAQADHRPANVQPDQVGVALVKGRVVLCMTLYTVMFNRPALLSTAILVCLAPIAGSALHIDSCETANSCAHAPNCCCHRSSGCAIMAHLLSNTPRHHLCPCC
jgi:hypothetical protein